MGMLMIGKQYLDAERSVIMVSFPLFVIAVIWIIYQLCREKPCPKGYTYDMYKAQKDRENGVSATEWKRRYNKGYYWVSQKELEKRQKKLNEIVYEHLGFRRS